MRLKLFGRPDLGSARGQAAELLAYVCLNPGPMHRDTLVDRLVLPSRKVLRQLLWSMDGVKAALEIEPDWIQLADDVEVDVHRFDREGDLDAYGTLLEGWQQEWLLFERYRLEALFLERSHDRMQFHMRGRNYSRALHHANRTLRVEPGHETAWATRIAVHAATGYDEMARHDYAECTRQLAKLGVQPSQKTRALLR